MISAASSGLTHESNRSHTQALRKRRAPKGVGVEETRSIRPLKPDGLIALRRITLGRNACWGCLLRIALIRPIGLSRRLAGCSGCHFAPPSDRSPPVATSGQQADTALKFAPPRTTTPPLGFSVRTESRRPRFNCGAVRFQQHAESTILFETVSIWMKGGWKETRGVQRPTSTETPVSESRTASLNPFDTKRKNALSGASSQVRDMKVADR